MVSIILTDRQQYSKVNGHTSKLANVNCGIPQGSCLGPLLFLIYINDLPCTLQSTEVTMYADDTSILFSSKSIAEINEAVNSDLKRLQTWLVSNKLSLNVPKTQSMIFGSSINLKKHHMDNGDSEINLHINEDNLQQVCIYERRCTPLISFSVADGSLHLLPGSKSHENEGKAKGRRISV